MRNLKAGFACIDLITALNRIFLMIGRIINNVFCQALGQTVVYR
ncbi:hypothetical protein [Sporomusa malonica]|uniref:Uncharacterized protein n=1 Tax=Sporomusa malonica TaxID=112901 RepID=A0A1W2EHU5_9FIRM|nr:hypothetical protein [Sporomusa malonica]SMD09280.1 hypothetical protein SAMN04488500_12465 [Sporomusa malonica]